MNSLVSIMTILCVQLKGKLQHQVSEIQFIKSERKLIISLYPFDLYQVSFNYINGMYLNNFRNYIKNIMIFRYESLTSLTFY